LSDSFFFLSSYHESDDVVILSEARAARVAKDLLLTLIRRAGSSRLRRSRRVLRFARVHMKADPSLCARSARCARDDTLAAFALQ